MSRFFWKASNYPIWLKLCQNVHLGWAFIFTKFQLDRVSACTSKNLKFLLYWSQNMDFMLKLFSFLYASFYTIWTVLYLSPKLITRRVGPHTNLMFMLVSNDGDCSKSYQSSRFNMDDYQFLIFQVFKKDIKISRKSITLEKIDENFEFFEGQALTRSSWNFVKMNAQPRSTVWQSFSWIG